MGSRQSPPPVTFRPARPASRARTTAAVLLGSTVWIAAGWIGVVLLGHTYILWRLAVVTGASCVLSALALAWAVAVRRGEERRAPD
ncbi:hypothetical protein [Streptomyces sp. CB02460]|uniref:hypothetical protein n=1 Tax=Streptomyces sp. CB02460 TaxID=1703941 RepID=UPI00093D0C37|nr:hypothetical protein [Streptomyces sp. CB02460]OKJ74246.1 hypothetical protein AMK30_17375 [Streptomyces sp. CB02460]